MAIKCRGEKALGGLYTGINIRHIVKTSKMVFLSLFLQLWPLFLMVGLLHWTLLIGLGLFR